MKNRSPITNSAYGLLILGGIFIAFIIISVLISGSWSKTPEIVQIWGSFIRSIGEIPIIGTFSFIFWGIFLLPGYFLLILGAKIENKKISKSEKYKDLEEKENFKKYTVFVDENSHYMDKSERYKNGDYSSEREAVLVCRKIVDDYLLSAYKSGMTADQLYESYKNFGDDPFIRGVDESGTGFSAWTYAEKRSHEIVDEKKSRDMDEKDLSVDLWKHEIDHKYGLLIPESEILEDDEFLYFYQTNRNKLCVAWNKKDEKWKANIDRTMIDGLSFSTMKRFEENIFANTIGDEGYFRKQNFIEFLLEGLGVGEIKKLTKELNNEAKIEFSIAAENWNEMLIGNPVGIEGGACKYFENNSSSARILHFALLCTNGQVTIEFLLGDYEDYEQHSFRIKEFGGYYAS